MRLFIAVAFPDEIRDALARGTDRIRDGCARGSFSRSDNYHLTLCFLGETPPERLGAIVEAMETVAVTPMELTVGHMGRFSSRSGDVLFRAVEAGDELFALQRSLAEALTERGFHLEKRRYVPHLTVARRAQLCEGVTLRSLSDRLTPVRFTARSITLFRSELRPGGPLYTPLRQIDSA